MQPGRVHASVPVRARRCSVRRMVNESRVVDVCARSDTSMSFSGRLRARAGTEAWTLRTIHVPRPASVSDLEDDFDLDRDVAGQAGHPDGRASVAALLAEDFDQQV
jgi:hypothetical protein